MYLLYFEVEIYTMVIAKVKIFKLIHSIIPIFAYVEREFQFMYLIFLCHQGDEMSKFRSFWSMRCWWRCFISVEKKLSVSNFGR